MQTSQKNSKPHSYGNRDRSTAKYVPRNQNRGGRNQGKPYMASIKTYSDLRKAWRSELVRNPNASARDFVSERRVKNFFSQEDGELQVKFLNSANGMKAEIAQHKRDCEKTARIFNSQGYYVWGDAWEKFGKNPEGPYPECTHKDLKEMFRLRDSNGNLTNEYDDHAYEKLLNRGCKQSSKGDVDHYIKGPIPKGSGIKITKDEMSNAELGTILSGNCNLLQKGRSCHCGGKGHPEQLISKIKKSKEENPSFYKKDMGGYSM